MRAYCLVPLLLCALTVTLCLAQSPDVPGRPSAIIPGKPWHFAVSGDSRNCGDVVMPAIAQGAARDHAQFYWHLGDLRAIYDFDEDILQDAKMKGQPRPTIAAYERNAWKDFRQSQTVPFGGIPFFLGIGNHETVTDLKNREAFAKEFADFLDNPQLKAQREKDSAETGQRIAPAKTYFHWVMDGVDFIYLDNATVDQFDSDQMAWFKDRMASDSKDNSPVHTVVVGMHEALPNSISANHSMNQENDGGKSGIEVYKQLLDLQKKRKVYVLASHSHYYMEDTFNTPYWRSNGGILPGWIVGTAGAHRYALPEPNPAKVAKTNVYGYLLGTVNPSGAIQFEYRQFDEKDIPATIVQRYSQDFVHWCFVDNTDVKPGAASTPEH
jgi:Calcineurin-like phosphoesterase